MRAWNTESIAFYADAEAYTGLSKVIAEHCRTFLPTDCRILECGCGLGFLSRGLLPFCSHLTAVDSSPEAMGYFQSSVGKDEKNLTLLQEDAFSLPESLRADILLCCFFASIPEALELASAHGAKTLLTVKKLGEGRRFNFLGGPDRRTSLEDAEGEVRSMGLSYEKEIFEAEMGQPLRSLAAGLDFLRLYSDSPEEISTETLLKKAIQTGEEEYPYFISAKRKIGILKVTL